MAVWGWGRRRVHSVSQGQKARLVKARLECRWTPVCETPANPREQTIVDALDSSHHPWLEDRGPKLTLLIAVDDATGVVAQAVFRTTEDTRGYLVLLEGLVRQWGIPLALYSDRHAAFKYNARQKPVPVETTQFARVMRIWAASRSSPSLLKPRDGWSGCWKPSRTGW